MDRAPPLRAGLTEWQRRTQRVFRDAYLPEGIPLRTIPGWAAPAKKTSFPLGMSAPHMVQAMGYVYPDGTLTYSVATTAPAELWMSLNACWIAQGGIS